MKLGTSVATVLAVVLVLASLTGLSGCGGGGQERAVAPVKGKVTANGQPVKGGSVTFRPTAQVAGKSGVTGKPASGAVKDDGTFVLSTYGDGDGAVIGKHVVTFTPFMKGPESDDDKPAPSPYAGMVPKSPDVEVKPGANDIAIELAKP